MDSKLNNLLKKMPRGAVATQMWLEKLGVYRQLTRRYVEQGWLERLGHGAFIRAEDPVDWLGGVYALQAQLELPVHIGADTALTLKGMGHYLPMGGKQVVHLFGTPGTKLPSWFRNHTWDVDVRLHCPNLYEGGWEFGFSDVNQSGFSVWAASLEQAMLETIYLASDNASLIHAHQLMEGLTTLRPAVVQELLEACRSVRVKRYFLWSAETAGHAWFQKLDVAPLNLGKGNRQMFKGGTYDGTYHITVPPLTERLPDV